MAKEEVTKITVSINTKILEEFDRKVEGTERSKMIEVLMQYYLILSKIPDKDTLIKYLEEFKKIEEKKKND
jgi:metal-responsive CopG/Arc/MetJ family transcriptional regulator